MRINRSWSYLACFVVWLFILMVPCLAPAQISGGTYMIAGVYVDTDGTLRLRQKDAADELNKIRVRARTTQPAGNDNVRFVSLPKLFAEARALIQAGRELPPEIRYLSGLTQVRYVLVYPQEKDLVIAGPAEPIDSPASPQPKGRHTGRPVLQLDDLVVALRMAADQAGPQPFGCSIDPPANSVETGQEVLKQYGSRSRKELADALVQAIGPQQVRFFGVPADTRVAFVCVAADYQLKRYSIGLDAIPVAGIGHSIDSSRPAGNRFWFETLYEPLLVSRDGNAFELRGQRLQLRAGDLPFEESDATPKAKAFARLFTAKMPALAAAVPLFADLQNLADLSLLANLIRRDKLDQRIAWDLGWVRAAEGYRVKTVPVPRATDTLVNFTSGSLAAGGVGIAVERWLAPSAREIDGKDTLAAVKEKRPG